MEKIKVDDYSNYEKTSLEGGKGKRKRKENEPPTKSNKEGYKQEIQEVKLARVEEMEKRIAKHLSFFPKLETDESQKQVQNYIEWLKVSLELKSPRFNPENENEIKIDSFLSSVKAGGQHQQKNRTAVRLTHLPTLLAVKNEDERSFEQNKKLAKAALLEKLEEHLKLWQTLERDSLNPVDIENIDFLNSLKNKLAQKKRGINLRTKP